MTYFLIPIIINKIDINDIEFVEGESTLFISKTLHKYLKVIKENIDNHHVAWDIYKKYTNPYEFIHTPIPNENTSIAIEKPLSRSYFKLIEMVKGHSLLDHMSPSINSFHLAEGPGGFIEALVELRKNKNDKYYGITLQQNTIGVPGWNKATNFMNKHKNVYIENGLDNTGNLYHFENLQYCFEKYGNTMDFITGDGGFDFSVDFNEQENDATRLLFSQMCFAISLQKKGGTFILKFFDMLNTATIDLVYLLNLFYDQCYISKPCTSRSGNSERYLICKNFLYSNTSRFLSKWKTLYELIEYKKVHRFLNIKLPYLFINKLEEINLVIGKNQIENILYTMRLIKMDESDRIQKLNIIKKKNIEKAISWCVKYSIPYYKNMATNIFIRN